MSGNDVPRARVIPPKAPAPGFGAALAGHLEAQRLSQARLAERIGCEHSYISRLISAGRAPSREMVVALADALGLGMVDRLRLEVLALIPERDQRDLLAAIESIPDMQRYRDAVELVDAIRAAVDAQRDRRAA